MRDGLVPEAIDPVEDSQILFPNVADVDPSLYLVVEERGDSCNNCCFWSYDEDDDWGDCILEIPCHVWEGKTIRKLRKRGEE